MNNRKNIYNNLKDMYCNKSSNCNQYNRSENVLTMHTRFTIFNNQTYRITNVNHIILSILRQT